MRLLIPVVALLAVSLAACTQSTCEAVGGACVGSTEPCSDGFQPALGGGCGMGVCCLPVVDAGFDAGFDAGIDSGTVGGEDAGEDAGTDGGTVDAGFDGGGV